MNNLTLKAPAKINLNLKILDKRKDGYHNIKSEFRTINLFDNIKLTLIPEGIQLITSGKYRIPNNRDNLVFQIAEKLRSHAKGKVGVKIELDKQIPLFAGLGGGSSDAATVMQGLNQLWDLNLSNEKQVEIGKKIGADIPFFLYGGHCLVEGIGEKVTPLKIPEDEQYVIIAQLPYIKISTPWAYSQWDKLQITNYESNVPIEGDTQKKSPLRGLGGVNENDFEKVIFQHFPDLRELKEFFLQSGANRANMTGSGSAIYGIFAEKETAQKCLEKIKGKCEFVYLGKTTKK